MSPVDVTIADLPALPAKYHWTDYGRTNSPISGGYRIARKNGAMFPPNLEYVDYPPGITREDGGPLDARGFYNPDQNLYYLPGPDFYMSIDGALILPIDVDGREQGYYEQEAYNAATRTTAGGVVLQAPAPVAPPPIVPPLPPAYSHPSYAPNNLPPPPIPPPPDRSGEYVIDPYTGIPRHISEDPWRDNVIIDSDPLFTGEVGAEIGTPADRRGNGIYTMAPPVVIVEQHRSRPLLWLALAAGVVLLARNNR